MPAVLPGYSRDLRAKKVPKAHLTDITVRSLKPPPPGRNITYFDDQTPGFGIRVSYSGRKTWIVMRGKERARTRLGYYPDLSLAAARNRAKALLLEQRPWPTSISRTR